MSKIAKLFRWHRKVEIKERNVSNTVWLRLVGDIDHQQAYQHALVASREMRKKLRDKDSLEYKASFLDLDDREKSELVIGTLLSEVTTIRDIAVEELGDELTKPIKEIEGDSLEVQEKRQEAEDNLEKDRLQKLRDKMDEKSEQRREELEKLELDELKSMYVTASINMKCLEMFSSVFRDYCVFVGTYTDEKLTEKAFDSLEEFRNMVSTVKKQLLDAYLDLEITGEDLKN